VAHNFNCRIEAEGILACTLSLALTYAVKVVMSRKQFKTKTSFLQAVCRISPFSMTLTDLQGNSPTASLLMFSYNCAAVDKISATAERRAVPLR